MKGIFDHHQGLEAGTKKRHGEAGKEKSNKISESALGPNVNNAVASLGN